MGRGLKEESPPISSEVPRILDGDVVVILTVLLCAVVCAIGVLSAVKCALRCCSGQIPGGVAASSARRKALKSLPTKQYAAGMKIDGGECAICLSEFAFGERIRILPNCGHGFHANCVDRWLAAHSSCPICRQCLFSDAGKPSGEFSGRPSQPATVAPLQPEAFLVNYRFGY